MLQLKNIKKDYETADYTVHALKGVDLRFRKNEFVSILGPSGCGKTTLLNIIGGLDHYTSGDLVISGVSTKDYKDHDWDVYRNHRIGFVFQSYNLIPHQTVLGNVELALTIAGISKTERRKRAEDALRKVGLDGEFDKRPNQLSGGQMQRVAIARALVNNPEILLADEPTGALDTVTSVQIMDLIREIAGERLVIMVTHNPELAEEYSSRIVRLQDGLVISDSNPYEVEENEAAENTDAEKDKTAEGTEAEKPKTSFWAAKKAAWQARRKERKNREKSSMSFKTSLGLSARNLATKKGRTAITSFAGSIGIISVCLVLALSNGFNGYILKTEEDMLSFYPIEIMETTMDTTTIIEGMTSLENMPDLSELDNKIYVNSFLSNMAQGMTVENDLSKDYQNYLNAMDKSLYSAIKYNYGIRFTDNFYTDVKTGQVGIGGGETTKYMSLSNLKEYYKTQLSNQDAKYAQLAYLVDYLGEIYGRMPGTLDFDDDRYGKYVLSQYDVVKGHFPKNSSEAVLVIGGNNDMTDLTLAQLGFISENDFLALFNEKAEGENSESIESIEKDEKDYMSISFDEILNKKFVLYDNSAVYKETTSDKEYAFEYKGERNDLTIKNNGVEITISGILRLKEGLNYGCLSSGLNFTEKLGEEFLARNMDSRIAKYIRNGMPYASLGGLKVYMRPASKLLKDQFYYVQAIGAYVLYDEEAALRTLGGTDAVNSIQIYTNNFETKEGLIDYLDAWNTKYEDNEAKQVRYTDRVGLMMGMVQTILDAITYVLVAFTAISLVVSSVMIGIITYVSVVERTKEIGVLRSLGARKKDIKNLFNAETFIIGLVSGVFGVIVTYLLTFGVNAILVVLTGIATLADLPIASAITMVIISVVLTLISGLIPAQAAAKKDPVVALRTE